MSTNSSFEETPQANEAPPDLDPGLDALARLDIEIGSAESRLRSDWRIFWVRIVFFTITGLVLALAVYFILLFISNNENSIIIKNKIPISIVVFFYITGLSLFATIVRLSRLADAQAEIEAKKIRRRVLSTPAGRAEEQTGTQSYFESLVRINVENLAAYYTLVKAHTNKSFMVSLVAGVFGLTLIFVGLILGFLDNRNAQVTSYIASGSGVATEFIAAIFFYLYNRTVRQMKEYHDSLLSVQNILLSFKIVGDTQNEREKVKMVGQMLTYLIGRQATAKPNGSLLPAIGDESKKEP